MPWGPPSQRGSAFVKGGQSCHGDRKASLIKKVWPQVQTRNEETKWMLATVNLAKRRGGVRSLTGPRLKKVPRLNLNTTQRAVLPSPQKNKQKKKQLVPPKLLTFV